MPMSQKLPTPVLDDCSVTFCVRERDSSRALLRVGSCNSCPSASGFFHSARCPQPRPCCRVNRNFLFKAGCYSPGCMHPSCTHSPVDGGARTQRDLEGPVGVVVPVPAPPAPRVGQSPFCALHCGHAASSSLRGAGPSSFPGEVPPPCRGPSVGWGGSSPSPATPPRPNSDATHISSLCSWSPARRACRLPFPATYFHGTLYVVMCSLCPAC